MSKINDGMQIKGAGVEIPDVGRDDLPAFFVEKGCKVGAEIGVYKGHYTRKLLSAGLKVYGIDPWMAYGGYKTMEHASNHQFQDRQDELYGIAQSKVSKYPLCTLIRKTSMDALKDFKDESLDFVYIDAHHGLKYVVEDIWEWSTKIKKGGFISGHDYGINQKEANDPYVLHVKYAVDAYTLACGIKDWYILGSKDLIEGQVRDPWRSFIWQT